MSDEKKPPPLSKKESERLWKKSQTEIADLLESKPPSDPLTLADARNLYESLLDVQQNLKNSLQYVEHQIERFKRYNK